MVPTPRFWSLVALGIPIAAIAVSAGMPSLIFVYDLLLVVAAYVTARLAPSGRDLRLVRIFDPVLSVRAQNRVVVTVMNDGAETLVGTLREEPPPSFLTTRKEFPLVLAPGRTEEYSYVLTPQERGSDYFRGTFLRLACPLGLVSKIVRLPTEQPVRVYPNILAMREFDLLNQQGRLREIGIRRSRMRGLGTEFESLREYAEGDDFRKMDWKASARRGKLIVRQYEQERNQCVIICLDVGRLMLSEVNGVSKLDHALDACLMLMHAAAAAGDFVGLLVYAEHVKRYIPPRKGRNQVGKIIEALHDLVAEPVETDPAAAMAYLSTRWKRRALMVTFTDVDEREAAKELVTAFGPMARRHMVLVVRVSDGRIQECVERPLATVGHMYDKAAALMLQTDRREADSLLSGVGVHSLESEPQDLAAALVSFYFRVKERSLL